MKDGTEMDDAEFLNQSFGEYLRNERERRGFSLEEIHGRTKIPTHFLITIERDDFDNYPEDTYAKGFLTAYADCIGLEREVVMLNYRYALKRYRETQDKKSRKSLFRMRGISYGKLLTAAGLLFLLTSSYIYNKNISENPVIELEINEKLSDRGLVGKQQQEEMADKRITVSVTARSGTWVKTEVDGVKEDSEILDKGDIRKWEGRRRIKLSIGDPESVDIFLNGRPYSPSNAEKRRVFEFTADNTNS